METATRPSVSSEARGTRTQRTRILSAMVRVTSEDGTESATVARVLVVAGVSRKVFYELFEGRDDCLRAALDDAVGGARERASAAYDPHAPWAERTRAGLCALLQFIDDEPELARVCIKQALASPGTLNGRGETLDQLMRLIDEGRTATRSSRTPPPFAAQGVLGGVLGLIYARLSARDSRSFVELLNPSMSMIVLPYLGAAAARRELARPIPARPPAPPEPKPIHDPWRDLKLRLTYRTVAVLEVIGAEPGLSNIHVADRAGIADPGQISKLLKRVASHGLAENLGAGQSKGEPNAWRLTGKGQALLRSASRLP
jgi:AcrR family transcriptional regulator